MRPGLEPTSSLILVGFVSAVPQQEFLMVFFVFCFRATDKDRVDVSLHSSSKLVFSGPGTGSGGPFFLE